MKRFTYWPQLFLGFTFNYGLILAWISIHESISLSAIFLYIGAIFWTLGYDTIYGYQDIKDDEIIGVKSTSIKFKKNPKWIVGYSDITAIHSDLHIENSESIHAIMCKSLNELDIYNDESVLLLKKTLFGEKLSYQIKGNSYNIEGDTKGQLVGGNLTLLHCLLGSKSSINTDGKILFIEDLGEYLYHIDRMLYSLKRAGYFDNLKGIIVGDFTDLRKNTTPFGRNLNELILEIVSDYNIPVAFDFPAGHGEENFPMIFGREIEFSVKKEGSSIIFSD